MKKYKFKDNTPFKDEDAESIGVYIEQIFPDQNPDPEILVEKAKNPRSPLHKFFDWDDASAAKRFRLSQAKRIISALYVELTDGSEIKAYENIYIKELESTSYLSTDKISEQPDLYNQVIEQAKKELLYWKTKYEAYRSFFPNVFKTIEGEVHEENQRTSRSRTNNKNTTNRAKNSKNNPRRDNPTFSK